MQPSSWLTAVGVETADRAKAAGRFGTADRVIRRTKVITSATSPKIICQGEVLQAVEATVFNSKDLQNQPPACTREDMPALTSYL